MVTRYYGIKLKGNSAMRHEHYKMKRKTLQEVLANPYFIKFIEDLKNCSTVKEIYIVGSMVRKGVSNKDVDIKVVRIEQNMAGDKEIYNLVDSFPHLSPHKKKLTAIKYFMIGDILINVFWSEMRFDKPYTLLWRNESA